MCEMINTAVNLISPCCKITACIAKKYPTVIAHRKTSNSKNIKTVSYVKTDTNLAEIVKFWFLCKNYSVRQ